VQSFYVVQGVYLVENVMNVVKIQALGMKKFVSISFYGTLYKKKMDYTGY